MSTAKSDKPDHTRGCLEAFCQNRYKDHRWGHSEAQAKGWFFPREGGAWCPDHLPSWVPAWRAKKEAR